METFRRTAVWAVAVALVAGCASAGRSNSISDTPAGMTAQSLRCEYLVDPIGLDEPRPRLSWTLADDRQGARQTAYQIVVSSSPDRQPFGKPDLWDSGKIESSEQNQIEYNGAALTSRQACAWRVRVWDADGRPGPWSDAATWEVGLREKADWQAKWIGDGPPPPAGEIAILEAKYESLDHEKSKDVTALVRERFGQSASPLTVDNASLGGDPALNKHKQLAVRYTFKGGPEKSATYAEHARVAIPPIGPQVLRRSFASKTRAVRARLYATALGLYDVKINGRPVTDSVFNPHWTDYRQRVRYQAYDVTQLLKTGDNVLTCTVANGFYAGHIGNGAFQFYGKTPAVLAQLEMTDADGTVERVVTDETWQSHAGPLLASDIMLGEDYDARSEAVGVASDGAWSPVTVKTDGLPPAIGAQVDEPIRELMTLTPKAVSEPTAGHYVFDMGQNMVGVELLRVSAPAGTKITVRFAEMLNPDGTLYTDNYRGATSTDTYVCRGGGVETWRPRFTYHGFRYVELTGLPTKPGVDAVTGVVQGSDTLSTGTFTCSDPRINRLWSNIRWGQRGNFFGVPTDCPQRDERLGWTGDAQVFIGTAAYNADVAAFFTKWLVDMDDAQAKDGAFQNTVPKPSRDKAGAPGWADAGVICPWTVYTRYGDKQLLAQHFPAMMRWVDWCTVHSTNLIRDKDRGDDFGDWLSIKADTSKELLGTAYFAYSTDLVARSAKALGDDANAAKYAALFEQIKAAICKKYVAADGSIINGTQTAYALALAFDLLPEADRPAAARRLADDVKARGDHLSTGFLGVSYLLPALANHGQPGVAYRLLMQDTFPSWLFSIKHGATTIWERWDGWTPDKGFQDKGMNSFNHYSLGSCGQWLYEAVAGIRQPAGGAGFAHVDVCPTVGGGLTHAAAEYESIRGRIKSAWKIEDGRLTMTVTIPPNMTATVRVPTRAPADVIVFGKNAATAAYTHPTTTTANAEIYDVGAGTYQFTAKAIDD